MPCPGHWEGDLIMGTGMRAIGTLVERSTRYVMLFALPDGHGAESVRKALAKTIVRLPTELRRSITWDQGREMHEHARFTIDTGVQIYFCDPKSPWQRGSNENTNGLVAPVLPQGHRALGPLPGASQCRCPRAQRTSSTHPRWHVTISGVRRGCCVDRLSPHRIPGSPTSPESRRSGAAPTPTRDREVVPPCRECSGGRRLELVDPNSPLGLIHSVSVLYEMRSPGGVRESRKRVSPAIKQRSTPKRYGALDSPVKLG